ncbi:hypothetical protein [Paraburkholderia sp.]|uniref:4'-phosphopantetheinyl transferase family protein n=1 Tax=Paraburkholderia sp. TaxID=1926495 RepID=UPI002399229C|nr:hypothetical protein [Paraburkholderia sp.]MDE1179056.1 hypothetical protein [Paraburkholderia sp.]
MKSAVSISTGSVPRVENRIAMKPLAPRTLLDSPELEFVSRRFQTRIPSGLARPAPTELQLWRFRPEWRAMSREAGYDCLSKAELARIRNTPNPVLGKRFAVGRAVLREILAGIEGCPASDIALSEGVGGRLKLTGDHAPLSISIAYAGIWILAGISTRPLGLAASMPGVNPPTVDEIDSIERHVELRSQVRHASLVDAAGTPGGLAIVAADSHTLSIDDPIVRIDTPHAGHWQVLDLPMPGAIYAAAAVTYPVRRVTAFGWGDR